MKSLLLVRHAKSSWDDLHLADHDRPLNARGKGDAPEMGRLLAEEGLVPDVILSSTAARARKTAELIAEACGFEGRIGLTRELYHAGPEEMLALLREAPESAACVMLVGHNPGMEEMIDWLTDESVRFTTANIALIHLPIERWADLSDETEGKLVGVMRPTRHIYGGHSGCLPT